EPLEGVIGCKGFPGGLQEKKRKRRMSTAVCSRFRLQAQEHDGVPGQSSLFFKNGSLATSATELDDQTHQAMRGQVELAVEGTRWHREGKSVWWESSQNGDRHRAVAGPHFEMMQPDVPAGGPATPPEKISLELNHHLRFGSTLARRASEALAK